jgi:hypothetical protein
LARRIGSRAPNVLPLIPTPGNNNNKSEEKPPPSRKRLNDLSLQNVILVSPLSEDLRSFASASVVNSWVEEQEV